MLDNKKVLTLVGRKFYRYLDENDESSLEIIRVAGVQNVESIKIMYEDGTVKKIDPNYVLDNYRAIKSDGIATFAIVSIDDGYGNLTNDVIVCLYKQSEIDSGNNMPYAVCRQNVNDIFYEYLSADSNKTLYAGCSVSVDSIPAHLDLNVMLQCVSVDRYYTVQVYMDDSLDDILKMVKTSKYDEVLKGIQGTYVRNYEAIHGKPVAKGRKSYHGYCDSLKTLLEENNFMYDFNTCFGIVTLDFKVETIDDNETCRLHGSLLRPFMDTIKKNVKTTYVVPYDKTIDLSNIKMGYVITKDKNNDMYVIGYLEEGEYVILNVDEQEVSDQLRSAAGINISKYTNK